MAISEEATTAMKRCRDQLDLLIVNDDANMALKQLRECSSLLREARARIVAEQEE